MGKNMNTTKAMGIAQLLTAALIVLVGWHSVVAYENRLVADAVYAEDARASPTNEGKRVVVAGTLRIREAAADTQLKIDLPTLCAERVVERIRFSDGEASWINVDEWPTRSALTDKTLTGKASIGQFVIDPKLIAQMATPERDWQKDDLTPDATERLDENWNLITSNDLFYLAQTPWMTFDDMRYSLYEDFNGSYRVRYRIANIGEDAAVTLVGIQRGNTLCYDPSLKGSLSFEGALAANQIVDTGSYAVQAARIICAAVPASLFLVLGGRNLRACADEQ